MAKLWDWRWELEWVYRLNIYNHWYRSEAFGSMRTWVVNFYLLVLGATCSAQYFTYSSIKKVLKYWVKKEFLCRCRFPSDCYWFESRGFTRLPVLRSAIVRRARKWIDHCVVALNSTSSLWLLSGPAASSPLSTRLFKSSSALFALSSAVSWN